MQRRLGLIATLVLALASSWALANPAGDAVYIDVRTAAEYAGGHVDQAVNIPFDEIAARIGEVTTDLEQPIILYCRTGRRSDIAKHSLEALGYSHVTDAGGYEELQAQLAAKN